MSFQVGNYSVDHCKLTGEAAFDRYPFWSSDPSIGYFMGLAQAGIRAYWRNEDGALTPIQSRRPIPELIKITDDRGTEICRWSITDELRSVRKLPAGSLD
jgi:hypothetical protein